MKKLGFLLSLLVLFALACAPAEEPPAPEPAPEPAPAEAEMATEEMLPSAMAILHDGAGEEVGWARFVQEGSGVRVTAEVGGLERAGKHGFHVHEVGECVPPDFTSAGGHYNPRETPHACPPDPERHAGDFGNMEVVDGTGTLDTVSELISVVGGDAPVVDRAVIVHTGEDDCVTQPTGAAGSRYACGVILLEEAGAGDEGGDEYEESEEGEEGEEGGEDYG